MGGGLLNAVISKRTSSESTEAVDEQREILSVICKYVQNVVNQKVRKGHNTVPLSFQRIYC